LFFDRFLLASGTWNSFSGGITPWQVPRPHIFGLSLSSDYAFYLVVMSIFAVLILAVWNLSKGKTGRVLRAIRNSEIAASTMGLNLTFWKLVAFGISAGLAGLAGGLLAGAVGSVSAGSYTFQQSLAVVAIATVVGVRSIGAAVVGGIFIIFGPELLTDLTPLSSQWFNLIVGGVLILQVISTPQGVVLDWQERFRKHVKARERFPDLPAGPPTNPSGAETIELQPVGVKS
jgi:branched-chain amino acid transport system permease protein